MASFFTELRRRNVVKVAIAYAVVGWIIVEASSVVLPALLAPEWVHRVVTFLILIGFPVALIFAWAFELTPEGLKRTHDVPVEQSISAKTGRKLDFAIIGLLAIAVVVLVLDNYVFVDETSPDKILSDESGQPTIAVLPFTNRSATEENAEFFAAGIHDDLLTQLAKLSALKVISRTSVMEYKDTTKNMREIGEELGAKTILEGGVQRAGDAVRINVQLIDTATDEHMWAETYDRELTAKNIFAIQSEIASAIANQMKLTLSADEVARLDSVPTQNLKSYDYFLQAREYGERATSTRESFELAIDTFDKAIREDPQFALAYAEKSLLQSRMYWYGFDRTPERIEGAKLSARQALELQPDLPEGRLAMGYYHYYAHRDYDKALKEFTAAAKGMPGDARVVEARGFIQRRLGQLEASLASLDLAMELSPRDGDLRRQQAQTYALLRRYDDAIRLSDQAQAVSPGNIGAYVGSGFIPLFSDGRTDALRAIAEKPRLELGYLRYWAGYLAAIVDRNYSQAREYISEINIDPVETQVDHAPLIYFEAYTHYLAGEKDQAKQKFLNARDRLEKMHDSDPSDARILIALGITYAGLGEDGLALERARRATELISYDNDAMLGAAFQYFAAGIYAAMSDVDRTVEALDTYLSRPGVYSAAAIEKLPHFDFVNDSPEFKALIAKYKKSGKRKADSGKK